jgi:phage FluMu protein Com
MATLPQTQLRCTGCNRRLADFVNEVQAGLVILELKCPRCGQPNMEVIRPSSPYEAENPAGSRARPAKAP